MLRDPLIALIRTAVPALVGWLLARLAVAGLEVDPDTQAQLTGVLVVAAISGYYALVTLLERKVSPAFGWLLGYAKAPTYVPPVGGPAPAGEAVADVVDLDAAREPDRLA